MVWALLAGFLTKKPPFIQALVVGLCTGLFVSAMAEANDRDPHISTTLVLILAVAVVAGGLFFLGLRTQHKAAESSTSTATWVVMTYIAVWVLSIVAALLALFGDGGFKVAVLAIVPIVLLGPTALSGIRSRVGKGEATTTEIGQLAAPPEDATGI